MNDPTKIIVYHSQMEQLQDEFWMAHGLEVLGWGGAAFLVFFAFVWLRTFPKK